MDECLDDNTCQNGATCQNIDGGFMCECAPGYDGTNCEIGMASFNVMYKSMQQWKMLMCLIPLK